MSSELNPCIQEKRLYFEYPGWVQSFIHPRDHRAVFSILKQCTIDNTACSALAVKPYSKAYTVQDNTFRLIRPRTSFDYFLRVRRMVFLLPLYRLFVFPCAAPLFGGPSRY